MDSCLVPQRFCQSTFEHDNLIRLLKEHCEMGRSKEDNRWVLDSRSSDKNLDSPPWKTNFEFPQVHTMLDELVDGNNNVQKTSPSFSAWRSPVTLDDFLSAQCKSVNKYPRLSCGHLADMTCAEEKLTKLGFCDFNCTKGLVPTRFLPSLVAFSERVTESTKHSRGITSRAVPNKKLLIANILNGELQTTSYTRIYACPCCGCYIWETRNVASEE